VPLLVEEPATARLRELYRADAEVAVCWTTPVECASALARLERDGRLEPPGVAEAFRRLDALAPSWLEVEPGDELRELARRLLRVHPLRSGDALQLASAILAAERRPPSLTLITLDDRLAEAAGREGFRTAPRT
jgi:predicted nucleic acid-binding protein